MSWKDANDTGRVPSRTWSKLLLSKLESLIEFIGAKAALASKWLSRRLLGRRRRQDAGAALSRTPLIF